MRGICSICGYRLLYFSGYWQCPKCEKEAYDQFNKIRMDTIAWFNLAEKGKLANAEVKDGVKKLEKRLDEK